MASDPVRPPASNYKQVVQSTGYTGGAEHDELLPGPQADEADRPRRYGRTQLAEDFRTWEGV